MFLQCKGRLFCCSYFGNMSYSHIFILHILGNFLLQSFYTKVFDSVFPPKKKSEEIIFLRSSDLLLDSPHQFIRFSRVRPKLRTQQIDRFGQVIHLKLYRRLVVEVDGG